MVEPELSVNELINWASKWRYALDSETARNIVDLGKLCETLMDENAQYRAGQGRWPSVK